MRVLCLAIFAGLLLLRPVCAQTTPLASPSPSPSPSATVKLAARKNEEPASASSTRADGGTKGSVSLPPEKSHPITMPLFDKPPVIDGKLDDEIWKKAVVLKDFYQTQPGDNTSPSKQTEVFLGYDPRFLYIAFHCYDDPSKVRANIPKRD